MENNNMNIYKHMLKRLEKLFFLHSLSADFFRRSSIGLMIPSIIITGLSSIASFLSTSSFLDANSKTGLGVTVGVLTVLSTMMQSFTTAFKFNAKVESHLVAASQYDTLITKVKFEQLAPDENKQDFFNNLETEILDIKNKCNYFYPKSVLEQWKKNKKKIKNNENKVNKNLKKKENDNTKDGIELNDIKIEKNI